MRIKLPLSASGCGRNLKLLDFGDKSISLVPSNKAELSNPGVQNIPVHGGLKGEDMNTFLSSLVPVFLIFIQVRGNAITNVNVAAAQKELRVGESAVISCSVADGVDIRQMNFLKNETLNILSLKIQERVYSSMLTFSGTFKKFEWVLEEGETMESCTCTDKKEMYAVTSSGQDEETKQITCPTPQNSKTMFLLNGTQEIASLYVDPPEYHSRLSISGSIRNLKITLTNVEKEDTDTYTCQAEAKGLGKLTGEHPFLTVRGHGVSTETGNLGLALAMALASCLYKLY
ncbi:uncharacterized protein [Dendropsophus ebraccatus]|uniref:uncharacterized protein n=1 Tax=Dendropsophus ebraccatus TaxID=150705 RepID=UPI00383206C9